MNTTRFARYFALPIVSAGIIGGAALGLAGAANAASDTDVRGPDVVATPDVKAHPAPEACRAPSGTAGSTKSRPCSRASPANRSTTEALPQNWGRASVCWGTACESAWRTPDRTRR